MFRKQCKMVSILDTVSYTLGVLTYVHYFNSIPEEMVFLLDNQRPYTFSELCQVNTILDTDNVQQDKDAYRHAPEEYGITYMDLQMMKTDIDD